MICSSKYNRKNVPSCFSQTTPVLFCFVLIAVFHRLRTNSSRPGTRKTVVIFRPAASASDSPFEAYECRKVGTTLTLPGFFFFFLLRAKQTEPTLQTLCSVDSKSFVGTGLKGGRGGSCYFFPEEYSEPRIYL